MEEREIVQVRDWIMEREGASESVCVCVCERERERERESWLERRQMNLCVKKSHLF